jgi:hypothetical protein
MRKVRWSPIQGRPFDRFFLVIDFDCAAYMGCLIFDDATFCVQIQHLPGSIAAVQSRLLAPSMSATLYKFSQPVS